MNILFCPSPKKITFSAPPPPMLMLKFLSTIPFPLHERMADSHTRSTFSSKRPTKAGHPKPTGALHCRYLLTAMTIWLCMICNSGAGMKGTSANITFSMHATIFDWNLEPSLWFIWTFSLNPSLVNGFLICPTLPIALKNMSIQVHVGHFVMQQSQSPANQLTHAKTTAPGQLLRE